MFRLRELFWNRKADSNWTGGRSLIPFCFDCISRFWHTTITVAPVPCIKLNGFVHRYEHCCRRPPCLSLNVFFFEKPRTSFSLFQYLQRCGSTIKLRTSLEVWWPLKLLQSEPSFIKFRHCRKTRNMKYWPLPVSGLSSSSASTKKASDWLTFYVLGF